MPSILRNNAYRQYVPPPEAKPAPLKRKPYAVRKDRKHVSPEDLALAIGLRVKGVPVKAIAERIGCSRMYIYKLTHGRGDFPNYGGLRMRGKR